MGSTRTSTVRVASLNAALGCRDGFGDWTGWSPCSTATNLVDFHDPRLSGLPARRVYGVAPVNCSD